MAVVVLRVGSRACGGGGGGAVEGEAGKGGHGME
eukprot:SAG22_NODE_4349_length_1294_cov_13.632636_3_plen_33_part_01